MLKKLTHFLFKNLKKLHIMVQPWIKYCLPTSYSFFSEKFGRMLQLAATDAFQIWNLFESRFRQDRNDFQISKQQYGKKTHALVVNGIQSLTAEQTILFSKL